MLLLLQTFVKKSVWRNSKEGRFCTVRVPHRAKKKMMMRVLAVFATLIQLGCALPIEKRIATLEVEHRVMLHEIDVYVQQLEQERINKREVHEEGGYGNIDGPTARAALPEWWKYGKGCYLSFSKKGDCMPFKSYMKITGALGEIGLSDKIQGAYNKMKGWFGEEESEIE